MTEKTLEQLYAEHAGKVSDKWVLYLAEYNRIFFEYRDKPIHLLEIGIQNGGSLEIWSKYFVNAHNLVGCDINPDCSRLSYEDPRVVVVVGDANSDVTETKVLEHAGCFEIIIDDGSHRSSDIVKSFARYFPHLVDGGIFVVEDLHCSYWQEYEGGLFDPFSSITFFKRLADVVNYEHWGIEKSRTDILRGFVEKYDFQIDQEVLSHIHSVEFINSMCVIRKRQPDSNALGARFVVGSLELVVPGLLALHSSSQSVPDQSHNMWAARNIPPDEQHPQLINEIAERDKEIVDLTQAVAKRDERLAELDKVVTELEEGIIAVLRAMSDSKEESHHLASIMRGLEGEKGPYASLVQALIERNHQIAALRESVRERDERASALAHQVAERDGQLAQLRAAVEAQQQTLAERAGELNGLTQAVAERDGQIASIYRSSSWRLTHPLRALRRLAGLLCGHTPWRFTRNAYTAIRGGVHRHRIIGFACRIPYYLRHCRTYAALLASRPPSGDGELFSAPPPVPHDIRLHPDLGSIGEPIDASVSVVIPTLNAGPEFIWLLRKLRAQRGLRDLEIVVVDSGSRDGTVENARAAGCVVVEIPPADFSHSYARNVGADIACGDYLLFMVQDAYPIGAYWAYGMLRYLLDHADERLAAVSCAEYSRSDSDMMYDSMINAHYRFLGCLDYDRIGEYQGDDHMLLRAHGQLSDVSCLISHKIFARYRYRGDYAEDLDLGIRLIKDAYRVAILASIKVVHSHNRPAYYYLKRSFVDVITLVSMFKDFVYPNISSVHGLMLGIVSTATHLSDWLASYDETGSERMLHEELGDWIGAWRINFVGLCLDKPSRLGDARLDAYISSLAERYLLPVGEVPDGKALEEARRFLDAFLARLDHFNVFAASVYGIQDAVLRRELRDVLCKTFAATAGSAMGFMYMDHAKGNGIERDMAKSMYKELKAGV